MREGGGSIVVYEQWLQTDEADLRLGKEGVPRAGRRLQVEMGRLTRRPRLDLETGLTMQVLGEDVDSLIAAVLGLDRSILPVQGPPGTGKTFRAARVVVAALAAGMRVGITAPSHAAIKNVLDAVEKHAHEEGQAFSAIYKPREGGGYEGPHGVRPSPTPRAVSGH